MKAEQSVFAAFQVKDLSIGEMISEVKSLFTDTFDDFTCKVSPWKCTPKLMKSWQDPVTSTLTAFPLEQIFGKLAC